MKNDIDNNLTDKGWQSMRRLLDREMPEQRHRRFVWWLFALLLLSLAGTGGWWLWRQSEPVPVASPPTEAPKVSEPVVNAENQREPGFDNFWKVVKSDTATVAVSNFPAVAGVPADPDKSGRSSILGEEYRNLVQPLPSRQVGIGEDANNGKKEPGIVVASPLTLVYPVETIEISEESNSTYLSQNTVKIETLAPLAPMPARSPNISKGSVATGEGNFAGSAIIKKKNDSRWSFGLAAGLASESFASLNGFSAGGAVDWKFARKWGLRSGLHYAQYRLAADDRPVVSVAAEDYTDATGNLLVTSGTGANPYQDADSVSVYVPVERLRQLEMPLLAYWQPVRALRIYGGVTIAYNLSAHASEQSFANNQYYYANTQQAKSNLNELAASNIQRWQTNLQTGLGFRLGKHFELGAFYKYGLSDLKSDDGLGTFDASITSGGAAESAGQKRASHYFLLNGIWFF